MEVFLTELYVKLPLIAISIGIILLIRHTILKFYEVYEFYSEVSVRNRMLKNNMGKSKSVVNIAKEKAIKLINKFK